MSIAKSSLAEHIRPPAQPQYILRGHGASIHAVAFARDNSRLLTGDTDGWVVLWNIVTKRAVAVWRPHNGSILGIREWYPDRVITHGRDSTLKVWQIRPGDEDGLSTALPTEQPHTVRKIPWMLHHISVNTISFCAFALSNTGLLSSSDSGRNAAIVVAVPGRIDSTVDMHHFPEGPSSKVAGAPSIGKTGMVMALAFINAQLLATGYESGHVCVFDCSSSPAQQLYITQSHTQPILSLACQTNATSTGAEQGLESKTTILYSSAADDVICAHSITFNSQVDVGRSIACSSHTNSTKHSGQQSLSVRGDGKILATAGWDGRVRVYACGSHVAELAVLAWHKQGCYAVAFAETDPHHSHLLLPEVLPGADPGPAVLAAPQTMNTAPQATDKTPISVLKREDAPVRRSHRARTRREQEALHTHWIAVGSKDGKVSLWDIY